MKIQQTDGSFGATPGPPHEANMQHFSNFYYDGKYHHDDGKFGNGDDNITLC